MFGRLQFDSDLDMFFSRNSGDKIPMILYNGGSHLVNELGNYIKRESGDSVSYLPKSKYDKLDSNDPYSDGIGRVSLKIGRFATKFLRKNALVEFNITPKDMEEFVNLYKSYFIREKLNFKVVEGEELQKWYDYKNYFCTNNNAFGTLWNSCMRQTERNKFMKLYAVNKDIKMLILLADDGRLIGRALLWDKVMCPNNLDPHSMETYTEYKFMDRIYTMYDHDVNLFKNWARDNGYIHKLEQSSRSETHFIKYDNNKPVQLRSRMYVKLENHKMRYYPYLDTFKFYDEFSGTFSNSDSFRYQYILVQSDGGLEPPPPPEEEFSDEEVFIGDDE